HAKVVVVELVVLDFDIAVAAEAISIVDDAHRAGAVRDLVGEDMDVGVTAGKTNAGGDGRRHGVGVGQQVMVDGDVAGLQQIGRAIVDQIVVGNRDAVVHGAGGGADRDGAVVVRKRVGVDRCVFHILIGVDAGAASRARIAV